MYAFTNVALGREREKVMSLFTIIFTGFAATVCASPVDVIKTRYMNSAPGKYKGALDCAIKTFKKEGSGAFYKGFFPSFTRLVSWNVVMWLSYEQLKKIVVQHYHDSDY